MLFLNTLLSESLWRGNFRHTSDPESASNIQTDQANLSIDTHRLDRTFPDGMVYETIPTTNAASKLPFLFVQDIQHENLRRYTSELTIDVPFRPAA
jgi:hypothetical protein